MYFNNILSFLSELDIVPNSLYEFPNGFNRQIGVDRFRISETLFDTSHMNNIKVGQMHIIYTNRYMQTVAQIFWSGKPSFSQSSV